MIRFAVKNSPKEESRFLVGVDSLRVSDVEQRGTVHLALKAGQEHLVDSHPARDLGEAGDRTECAVTSRVHYTRPQRVARPIHKRGPGKTSPGN